MAIQPLPYQGLAGTPRTGQYYRHSGQLNPIGVLAAALVGAVAAALLAVPYAYADKYIPEIHLNGIVCGIFGMVLGAVPAWVLRRFKVRNLPVSLAVIGVVALVGLYASWAAWEAILMRGGLTANLPRLLAHPDSVVSVAVRVNAVGTWGIGSSTSTSSGTHTENTTGWFLTAIWAAEAATLVAGAMLVGRSMVGSVPFCDACDRWCEGPTTVRRTALPADVADVRRRLEAGDFAHAAPPGPATGDGSLVFARHRCGGCGRLNTLTVSSTVVARDKKGRARRTTRRVLVNKLLVTPEDLNILVAPPPPPAAAT